MVLPLQIRITDTETRLTAAAVPYGVSVVTEMEMAFLVDVDGALTVQSPEEFFNKNHSKTDGEFISGHGGGGGGEVAAKPNRRKLGAATHEHFGDHAEGKAAEKADLHARTLKQQLGEDHPDYKAAKKNADKAFNLAVATEKTTNKTKTGAVSMTSNQLDALFPARNDTSKHVNANGTLSINGLDEHGNAIPINPKADKATAQKWADLGASHDTTVKTLVAAGKIALGIDLKTGKVTDKAQEAKGLAISVWYTKAHADAVKIAKDTGIPLDNVVAAHVVLSAGRQWSGSRSGNAETALALAKIAAHPITIEVSQIALDMMNWRYSNRTKGVGMIGLNTRGLKAGDKVNSNHLDTSTLVELMYATNATRGHTSLEQWKKLTTKDGKPGMKSSPLTIDSEGPFPFFTSKGTAQVKQSLALLRQEVTPRQGIDGPKFSSFYSNIRHPEVDYSITNDVWHYRIASGNQILTSYKGKGADRVATKGTIAELTLGKGAPDTAQGLWQKDDGMFRDVSTMGREALNTLKLTNPKQFGTMKLHEFQALIWVHFGGGVQSDTERTSKWDAGLQAMKEVGL